MIKKLKNERGLTLVELLAVIVILAIVGAIAFVMIGKVMENAKKDAAAADALQAINAAKLYETTGTKPKGNTDDFPINIDDLHKQGFIDTLYDPWTKEKYGTGANNKVNKDTNGYKVTLNASKCSLTEVTEAELIEKGREVCGEDKD